MDEPGPCGDWRFGVEAAVDPQSLPRVVGLFAQRSLTPASLAMRVADGRMWIDIAVQGLAPDRASIIAAKLREIFAVTACRLDEPAYEPA